MRIKVLSIAIMLGTVLLAPLASTAQAGNTQGDVRTLIGAVSSVINACINDVGPVRTDIQDVTQAANDGTLSDAGSLGTDGQALWHTCASASRALRHAHVPPSLVHNSHVKTFLHEGEIAFSDMSWVGKYASSCAADINANDLATATSDMSEIAPYFTQGSTHLGNATTALIALKKQYHV